MTGRAEANSGATTLLVVFNDLLSRAPRDRDVLRLVRMAGTDPGEMSARFRRFEQHHLLGAASSDFWSQVCARSFGERDPILMGLISEHVLLWARFDRRVVARLADLRTRGHRLVLLGDLPSEQATMVRRSTLGLLFEEMAFSSELGFRPTSLTGMQRVTELMELDPATCATVRDTDELEGLLRRH